MHEDKLKALAKALLEKNVLDLAYQRNLHLLNAILFIGVGTIISYFAAIIVNPEKIYEYSVPGSIVIIITYILYSRVNKNLKDISEKINNLVLKL